MNWNEFATEYFFRSCILIAAIFALIGFARRCSFTAAHRHAIGILGVGFALVMPLFLLSNWRWEILPAQEHALISSAAIVNAEIINMAAPSSAQSSEITKLATTTIISQTQSGDFPVFSIALCIWIAGFIGYLSFSMLGFLALQKLRKTPLSVPPGIQQVLDEILREQNHCGKVSLIVSPLAASPVMWGVFRPVIALPAKSVEWSNEQIRLVLLHELAHVARKDGASLMLRRCLLAFHWFNPLAWMLCWKLESLAEEACDGLVLRNGSSPTEYAELLFSMASGRPSTWVLPISVSGTQTLETRIKMIIKQPSKLVAQSRSIFTGAILGGISALAFSIATLAFAVDDSASQLLDKKLQETVIPSINMVDTPLKEAFRFIVDRSRELDKVAKKPTERGINIVMIGDLSDKKVSLNLTNIPVGESIQLIADLADVDLQKKDHVMIIRDPEKKKQIIQIDSGSEVIQEKLNRIVIPRVDFSNTPIKKAINYIRERSIALDSKPPSAAKGINIVLKPGGDDRRVTLRLNNVPIGELLSLTAEAAGYDINIRKNVVLVARDLAKGK